MPPSTGVAIRSSTRPASSARSSTTTAPSSTRCGSPPGSVDQLPAAALQRADGDGLSFVDLRPAQGAGWALAPRARHCRALDRAVGWADALCLRLPAVAGWHAARLARRQQKPAMFELIADPLAAGPGSLAARLDGRLHHHRTRWILRRCGLGSYVSASHLQARYPAAPGAATATIPSIRLDRARLRAPRTERWQSDRLRLIHVGSFLPVKNQALLIEGAAAGARRWPADLPQAGRRWRDAGADRAPGAAPTASTTG